MIVNKMPKIYVGSEFVNVQKGNSQPFLLKEICGEMQFLFNSDNI